MTVSSEKYSLLVFVFVSVQGTRDFPSLQIVNLVCCAELKQMINETKSENII